VFDRPLQEVTSRPLSPKLVLGTAVFDRPADFDRRIDTIGR